MSRPRKLKNRQIFCQLVQGYDHGEVAKKLGVSTKTIQRSARRWGAGLMTLAEAREIVEQAATTDETKWSFIPVYKQLELEGFFPNGVDLIAIGKAILERNQWKRKPKDKRPNLESYFFFRLWASPRPTDLYDVIADYDQTKIERLHAEFTAHEKAFSEFTKSDFF